MFYSARAHEDVDADIGTVNDKLKRKTFNQVIKGNIPMLPTDLLVIIICQAWRLLFDELSIRVLYIAFRLRHVSLEKHRDTFTWDGDKLGVNCQLSQC